ncbi:hypothetical protein [Amycolatopsis sp. cmx-8-4]|uniref:hypothetical protein n=1 Tax=Amycolatopsis sp. cmx-8-4 TaxID=2790947 RepID=UPI00397C893A
MSRGPGHTGARASFESVGDVVVPPGKPDSDHVLVRRTPRPATWMTEHGVAPEDANAYVAHVFGELGRTLLRHPGTLEDLAGKHLTPGAINEQFLTDLRDDGLRENVRKSLDAVLARVSGQ